MTTPTASGPAHLATIGRALLADRHFLAAASILAICAAAWGAVTHWLDIHTLKERVPWPSGVQISEDSRWISMPDRFPDPDGPFKKVDPEDGLPGAEGKPMDGEIVFPDHDLVTLGMGSDPKNRESRRSNWYVSRIYRDTRAGSRVSLWRIDVFYYTGGRDTVPHVPEICMGAGGLSNVVSDRVEMNLPALPEPWDRTVPLQRTRAMGKNGRSLVEYYTFSMNGEFGTDRLWVRGRLVNPFLRHAYFAKIQFSPLVGTADSEQMDRSAQEFLQCAMPEVLKALPSRRDVKTLEKGRR